MLSTKLLITILVLVSCKINHHISDYKIPILFLKDTITLDTTFLIERDFNINGIDDMIFGLPTILVYPKEGMSLKNYSKYKKNTINFYHFGEIQYEDNYSLKNNKSIRSNDSSFIKQIYSTINSKPFRIGSYKFIKKRMNIVCKKIGYMPTRIMSLDKKEIKSSNVLAYEIIEILPLSAKSCSPSGAD